MNFADIRRNSNRLARANYRRRRLHEHQRLCRQRLVHLRGVILVVQADGNDLRGHDRHKNLPWLHLRARLRSRLRTRSQHVNADVAVNEPIRSPGLHSIARPAFVLDSEQLHAGSGPLATHLFVAGPQKAPQRGCRVGDPAPLLAARLRPSTLLGTPRAFVDGRGPIRHPNAAAALGTPPAPHRSRLIESSPRPDSTARSGSPASACRPPRPHRRTCALAERSCH